MEHLIHLKKDGLNHIVADELKVGLANQVCDVVLAAGEEVVKADDLEHRMERRLSLVKLVGSFLAVHHAQPAETSLLHSC